ncbi:MAG: UDP-N-acetylglucosamine--N-acetylmuramyl-(pentapeptide) pyrophosphoryl-undecaprenol N-acetylglucosamine transferase [Oscillospiraceae bacterium]|nr:UDP-N-acetylglucosamine--N-acetylmuramyl-(pentapeptide) pyrophosphoryl-undecaprenol N-acetylglucosamine transferase [Oscillospiraceae bacterium]
MRFLFTCGGTAGHINPAIGVAGRLKQLLPESEFLFIGAQGMMEMELVPREGYEIRAIEISGLSRSLSLSGLEHNVHTVQHLLHSVPAAKQILAAFRPDVVIGTGGYVCYPVLRAAHGMGIPTLIHESNAVPGLTTKLLACMVDCVMLGFAAAAEACPHGTHTVYTGTPVRTEFLDTDGAAARAKLGIPDGMPLLVSVWGSLGSGHINGLMPEFMRSTLQNGDFFLVHSAGRRYYSTLCAAAESVCGAALHGQNVDLREYIFNMPEVMAAADLVMCRSGASTLGELAALGKPALLVPSPNVTGHHQEKNARLLERLGAAKVLLEGEFDTASLYAAAQALLCAPEQRAEMSAAMRSSAVPDALERIVNLILGYVS